jgi:radical SAM superfamily enzyme YgiQ (UPF0313 family)
MMIEDPQLDVLMVFSGGGDFEDPKFRFVLGAGYIIAYLREHGFTAQQFVFNRMLNVQSCVRKILALKPKVVGFTVYNSNIMQSILIARALKCLNSNIITIFGGPTSTIQSEDILKDYNGVDICVKGEGEEVLLEILEFLSLNDYDLNKIPIETIKGISYKKANRVFVNQNSEILYSHRFEKNYIDKYPSPYLKEVIPASEAARLGIITARGCNQNCIFCNCALLSKRNIYFHSIDRVIAELKYLSDNVNVKTPIPINDDAFTINPDRAKLICERIIQKGIKIPLGCITRADKINEELLDLMKLAGFIAIGFSLESGVPKILRSLGKVMPPNSSDKEYVREKNFIQKVTKMSIYAKKIGLKYVFLSIMIGLPRESVRNAKETLKLVKKLDLNFYTHNHLHLYKGTPIYEIHENIGYNITHIGERNKFFTINDHPFNLKKVRMNSRAADIQKFKVIDFNALQTFSLSPLNTNQEHFFNNVIIDNDHLKPSMVLWIQKNLAINGHIFHIYSNRRKYKELHLNNEGLLYDELSPTKYYENYYWQSKNGRKILKSGRILTYGENGGFPIEFKETKSALKDYVNKNKNLSNVIAFDNSLNDTHAFLKFFDTLSNKSDPVDYLFNKKLNPQFLNLCKWTSNKANCLSLETAIITKDGIKICWNADTISKFDKDFFDIKYAIESLRNNLEEDMNCGSCINKKDCLKCIYPYPLNHEQFCENSYKRNKSVGNVLSSFNTIKELLYKPISLYDF